MFTPWCEVCVKAKGTGAQHRRQTFRELAKQEQDGPRIYSDFFHMSDAGVSTPTFALKFSRSGRIAATALEKKGLSQYGVQLFAGFIRQTGVRGFINNCDGEPATKVLKDAAAIAPEGVESKGQESPEREHQANGDKESERRTEKAQKRATRFFRSHLAQELSRSK